MAAGANSKGPRLTKDQVRYRRLIKNLERFKKTCSTLIVILMFIACLVSLGMYIFKMTTLHQHEYFITRTYVTETKVVEFEPITATTLQYFLYRNQSSEAEDAQIKAGFVHIVEDVSATCDYEGYETI